MFLFTSAAPTVQWMDAIIVPKDILEEMVGHCREACPNEACGILSGKGNEVSGVYLISNEEMSPVSYLMDSREQFRVMKDMREKGLSMVAIFHSHPSSSAYPSSKDVSLAFYEDAVYVIASLAGEEPEVKAFSIRDGAIEDVEIVVREKASEVS